MILSIKMAKSLQNMRYQLLTFNILKVSSHFQHVRSILQGHLLSVPVGTGSLKMLTHRSQGGEC